MGNSDNKRPWYAVEDGHAQVGDGQVDQEVVGQTPHSTVGEHCPQHLDSRDHDDLRIRVPHSGKEEDFLSRQKDFFTETAVTSERKVEKSFPRWEINRHVEG